MGGQGARLTSLLASSKEKIYLALSGGGVRSAAISIGFIQAIYKAQLLRRIDTVSTVSGGGYAGVFLRSLFLPASCFGPEGGPPDPNSVGLDQQAKFAHRALDSEADERLIPSPKADSKIYNPMYWLRDHSRYLAPNGPSDYWSATAYLSRNWLALILTFLVPMGSLFWVVVCLTNIGSLLDPPPIVHDLERAFALRGGLALEGGAIAETVTFVRIYVSPEAEWVSPILPIALLLLWGMAVLSLSYLLSQLMPDEPDLRERPGFFERWFAECVFPYSDAGLNTSRRWRILLFKAAMLVGTFGLATTASAAALWEGEWNRSRMSASIVGIGATLLVAMLALLGKACHARYRRTHRHDIGVDVRSTLNRWLGGLLKLTLIISAIGVVDTSAIWLRESLRETDEAAGWVSDFGAASALASIPVGAALIIRRLARAIDNESRGRVLSFLLRFRTQIGLVVGLALWGLLAVLADALVQAAFWKGHAGTGQPYQKEFWVLGGALLVLWIGIAFAPKFINLSSLHLFYASRLTRAFIGATNVDRLQLHERETQLSKLEIPRLDYSVSKEGDAVAWDEPGIRITDAHNKDHISARTYFTAPCRGPRHIMTVTLNTSVSRLSELAERDRKGVPLTLDQRGIWIDGRPHERWLEPLKDPGVERWPRVIKASETLSMGQWIAISGAALGAGMGRYTSTAGALLFTLANMRLGYWWRPALLDSAQPVGWWKRCQRRCTGPLSYLWGELTASYREDTPQVYLTDGGHFDNSAVYALLERGAGPIIVAADNGQDVDIAIGELEELVRKARIDLGVEIRILSSEEVAAHVGGAALDLFLNRPGPFDDDPGSCWRARTVDADEAAFALLLEARWHPRARESDPKRDPTLILWVKPRLLPDLSADLLGYARANPSFPLQTTVDQFFDEAQWESYRMLGLELGSRLFGRLSPA